MAAIKEGDRVRIATRPATDEDAKAGTYFGYYGGLTGSVQKVYSNIEVSIDIEHESLTREIRKRHEEVRDQMKTKWLDGLSEEGRSKLTEREKDFNLRYVILVKMDDLEKVGKKPQPAEQAPDSGEPATPPRMTSAELAAAEEAELQKRLAV